MVIFFVIKNFFYKSLYYIDKGFLNIQIIYIKLIYQKKLNYTLFFGGWGQLVQSVFFTHLLNKKDEKLILVLDYEKFNLNLQNFSPNHKIKKLYSLLKFFNKDFAKYPNYIQQDIKNYCENKFKSNFINLKEILYNRDQTFFNEIILSDYFKRITKKRKDLIFSMVSFNSSKYNFKNKFFYPKKNFEILINKKLKIRINTIKKRSLNITVRLRNKNFKNSDRTNYLRDSNYRNLNVMIKYLLKKTDYLIFITGDCDEVKINHKNLIYYKKVQSKISKDLYTLAIQSLSNFHILQASGANELIKFNKSKALYIDCWPPMNFFSNSVMLFKNIYKGNKRVSCISYLNRYLNSLKKKNILLSQSKKNFIDYFEAKKFVVKNNSKNQIIVSLNEFLDFISNKKNVRKNYNLNNFYAKKLKENKSFLSKANFI